jgi:hypothetical protein
VECTSAEAALSILQRKGERVAFIFADEELAGPRAARTSRARPLPFGLTSTS